MNNLFQENKENFLLLFGLLALLLLVIYFLFFQPISKELNSKENQVNQLENDIAILEINVENAEAGDTDENNIESLKLANKMPMDPELEELVLMIEQIGMVSNSRIDSVSFSYDGSIPQRTVEDGQTEDVEATDQETEEDIQATEEEPNTVINMEKKPENLQIITVSMSVISPDYEHFQTFIKEIEKQERMMMVSSMDFLKPDESEVLFVEEPTESITTDVDITTFYYDN